MCLSQHARQCHANDFSHERRARFRHGKKRKEENRNGRILNFAMAYRQTEQLPHIPTAHGMYIKRIYVGKRHTLNRNPPKTYKFILHYT